MKCFCGGSCEKIRIDDKIIDTDGDILFIKDIPALYCEFCKQIFFDEVTSDKLDRLQNGIQKKHVISWSDQFGE